jgi:DNA-binding PadR family transcriptional regulator
MSALETARTIHMKRVMLGLRRFTTEEVAKAAQVKERPVRDFISAKAKNGLFAEVERAGGPDRRGRPRKCWRLTEEGVDALAGELRKIEESLEPQTDQTLHRAFYDEDEGERRRAAISDAIAMLENERAYLDELEAQFEYDPKAEAELRSRRTEARRQVKQLRSAATMLPCFGMTLADDLKQRLVSLQARSEDPYAIERDLEHTRRLLDQTIDEIQRLSSGQLLDEGLRYFRDGERSQYVSTFGHNLAQSVRDNPLLVAMMGVGFAWLAIGKRPPGTSVGRKSESAVEIFERQPLLAAAAGVTIGAVLSSLFPTTEREKEALGPHREELRRRMEVFRKEAMHTAKEAGRAAAEAGLHEVDRAMGAAEDRGKVENRPSATEQYAGAGDGDVRGGPGLQRPL